MLDTARHYYSINALKRVLDGMEMLKLNVFHWHMVDAQSFPFQSTTYPLLAQRGSYDYPDATYDTSDVQSLVDYGSERGIRIVPEFDMPAHTASWGRGYPELIVNCSQLVEQDGNNQVPMREHGIDLIGMNPLDAKTYAFVANVLQDVFNAFDDLYIHIGGDEVSKECWETNPAIRHWIETNGSTHASNLQAYFVNRILPFITGTSTSANTPASEGPAAFTKKKIPMGWDEILDLGDPTMHGNANGQDVVHLPKGTIIQWWRGWVPNVIEKAKKRQFHVVQSYPYYLDHLNEDWVTMYKARLSYQEEDATGDVLIGGEACMWSEHLDSETVESTVFSKLPAIAERLWSTQAATAEAIETHTIGKTARRMNYALCLLKQREGIHVGPAYPDYCSEVVKDGGTVISAKPMNGGGGGGGGSNGNNKDKVDSLLVGQLGGGQNMLHRRHLLATTTVDQQTHQDNRFLSAGGGGASVHPSAVAIAFLSLLWVLVHSLRASAHNHRYR